MSKNTVAKWLRRVADVLDPPPIVPVPAGRPVSPNDIPYSTSYWPSGSTWTNTFGPSWLCARQPGSVSP